MLPEDVEVAVAMRDFQGLSDEEVADILEISVSALKARLHRGQMLLRKFLVDYVKAPSRG